MGLLACDPNVEGCLDAESTNFDVSADKPCDACCTSPRLVIQVFQEFGAGVVWRPDSAYNNDLNQPFRINSVAFYLSDFQLTQNNEVFRPFDTLQFKVFDAVGGDTTKQTLSNDILLARRVTLDYPVGEFKTSGKFDAIQCQFGLSEVTNRVVPSSASSNNPLSKQSDSLWLSRSEGYVWLQVVVQRDTSAGTPSDTLRFTKADFTTPLILTKMANFERELGFDFKIKCTADYFTLFKGVDFVAGTPNTWKSKILANLPNMLTFSPP